MKIKMKIGVSGVFHNDVNGVARGDVVEVDDESGARYCALGYAIPVVEKKEERAVPPKAETRTEEPKVVTEKARPTTRP